MELGGRNDIHVAFFIMKPHVFRPVTALDGCKTIITVQQWSAIAQHHYLFDHQQAFAFIAQTKKPDKEGSEV